jgi:ABC-2 type transport system ATP-binding protein
MLAGLLEPSAGRVLFQGTDIREDLIGYKRRLGYVPEETNLYLHLTGFEYLELTGTLRSLEASALERKATALLELFSLRTHRHSRISSYSKGMRQKILIIAALLHDPDVLIFDEPLSGLDVSSVLIFRQLVKLLAERGKAVFYCSHVLEVVEKVCTHVLILRTGKVAGYGSVEEIRSQNLESLEETFSHLVDDVDAEKSAAAILDVVTSSVTSSSARG